MNYHFEVINFISYQHYFNINSQLNSNDTAHKKSSACNYTCPNDEIIETDCCPELRSVEDSVSSVIRVRELKISFNQKSIQLKSRFLSRFLSLFHIKGSKFNQLVRCRSCYCIVLLQRNRNWFRMCFVILQEAQTTKSIESVE